MAPVQQSAAAPALHVVAPGAGTATAEPPVAKATAVGSSLPVNYQPSLFRDAATGPKVIPIPTLTPLHPVNREPGTRRASVQAPTAPKPRRRTVEGQGTLDLVEETAPAAHADETILCDVPVAAPALRVVAAAVDGAIVLAGAVVLLTMFFLFAEGLALTRTNLLLIAGAVGAVAVLYRSVLCLGDGNTPGMRAAGLRLVDFDGRRPPRSKRMVRQAAGLLSWVSAGLGLVWALVDDEKLTWHDHISKTFPTSV